MTELSKDLLVWFEKNGRKSLPWQSRPPNGYHVWLSEVMLQQTQVKTVIGYFNNFIKEFPDFAALSFANEDAVLAAWAGLGYYSRARNLHKASKIILSLHGGFFPKIYSEAVALPGVGRSTAGAVLSLTYGQPHAILDGNVKRVLARYHRIKGHYSLGSVMNELWRLAEKHTPEKQNAEYTQAIMDIGAKVCTPRKPNCGSCPISKKCGSFVHKQQEMFPQKRLKKIVPQKEIAFLIFRNEKGEIHLEKRPVKGIWGGLWSFIECTNERDSIKTKTLNHNSKASVEKTLTKFKHSFSHFTLLITPIIIHSPGASKNYFKTNNISLGVPAPVRKIIESLDLIIH